jgi:hypothetical protein
MDARLARPKIADPHPINSVGNRHFGIAVAERWSMMMTKRSSKACAARMDHRSSAQASTFGTANGLSTRIAVDEETTLARGKAAATINPVLRDSYLEPRWVADAA